MTVARKECSVVMRVPLRGSPSLGESHIFTNVWRSIARFGSCAIKSDIHSVMRVWRLRTEGGQPSPKPGNGL
ncbi:hypothetical protein TNCV_2099841 [Trichonephila clavipes]|nr:hypothetical protein TNCV_2099841 [Trichonephila clavipes]